MVHRGSIINGFRDAAYTKTLQQTPHLANSRVTAKDVQTVGLALLQTKFQFLSERQTHSIENNNILWGVNNIF